MANSAWLSADIISFLSLQSLFRSSNPFQHLSPLPWNCSAPLIYCRQRLPDCCRKYWPIHASFAFPGMVGFSLRPVTLSQATLSSPRNVVPRLSATQPSDASREADGDDEAQPQSKSQSLVSLKMENAVLRAEFAEVCARECLSRMELHDANPLSAGQD